MNQNKIPIGVTTLRAEDYSSDGKDIIISLAIKYADAERKYSVPVECLHDLIVDLQRLNATKGGKSIETCIQPEAAQNSAKQIEG